MLTLDVAISTFGSEGLLRVEKILPSPQDGVRYVVSWQDHGNNPVEKSIMERGDVEVHRLEKSGLSNNRNNALAFCSSDIILIADDDLEYKPEFSLKIRKAFEENPDMDLGVFKIDFPLPKSYPAHDCILELPLSKGYYCSSVELAFRRDRIGDLRFWPGMGLGTHEFQCGEDELFLLSAIKRGLRCHFINETIAVHPKSSTGNRLSAGVLRGQGFIMGLIYPLSCWLRVPLKAWRIRKNKKGGFFSSLFQLINGTLASKKRLKNIPPSCRW